MARRAHPFDQVKVERGVEDGEKKRDTISRGQVREHQDGLMPWLEQGGPLCRFSGRGERPTEELLQGQNWENRS